MRKYQDDDLLTPGEVAVLFRVDPKTVTRWAAAGRFGRDSRGLLTVVRTPGNHHRFRYSGLRPYLEGENPRYQILPDGPGAEERTTDAH